MPIICNENEPPAIDQKDWVSEHREELLERLETFDFAQAHSHVDKVPLWFKQCKNSAILITVMVIRQILLMGLYPESLKLSKADILPSRTIFQIYNPVGKLVEAFFVSALDSSVSSLQNFAYRRKLSCTSLLLTEFDWFACEPFIACFNGDLVKAFDRMSRERIYDKIKNPLLASIIWSWMDRTLAPYLIYWRGKYHEIDRSSWNRGVEPGSVLGPILFIIGLDDASHFLEALFKAFFADDGFPLFRTISTMASNAAAFISYIVRNGMEMHLSGSKAATFMLVGPHAKGLDLEYVDITTPGGSFRCQRVYSTKQVGLSWYVDGYGRALVDLDPMIKQLKQAASALRGISGYVLSSDAIMIVKTYIISVVSYAIVIWFPISYHKNPDMLKKLRYWYASVMMYVCMDAKDCLGWCNSSKTMDESASPYLKLKELTGLPLIYELYLASARSHYSQIEEMVDLNMLEGTVKRGSRQPQRLQYCKTDKIVYGGGKLKHISPLFCLIMTVNQTGLTKLKFPVSDSWLVKFESEMSAERSKACLRTLQKILTLAHFGRIEDALERNRLKRHEIDSVVRNRPRIGRFLAKCKRSRNNDKNDFPAIYWQPKV